MIKKDGFTIIELLMASLIITIGLMAVISMIISAFTSTASLSFNLTASYLTQEGFEVVRRIRDTNFNRLYSDDAVDEDTYFWLENLMDESEDSVVGGLDYDSDELIQGKEDETFYINDGLYSYEPSSQETTFRREITLERDCYAGYADTNDFDDDYCGSDGAEYVLVTVEVTWEERETERSHKAKTKLFNWY